MNRSASQSGLRPRGRPPGRKRVKPTGSTRHWRCCECGRRNLLKETECFRCAKPRWWALGLASSDAPRPERPALAQTGPPNPRRAATASPRGDGGTLDASAIIELLDCDPQQALEAIEELVGVQDGEPAVR